MTGLFLRTRDTLRRRAMLHPAVLLGYLLLTLLMTWPLAAQVTTAIPGDSFDGWQNYWNLWWIKVALVDRLQSPLFTDLLYAPTGVGLYFHTLNPFNGLATLPVQLAGGLIVAYNSVVLLSWVVGGYGLFLLTRWLLAASGRLGWTYDAAAFLSGVIFVFSPFHMAHLLGHMQVMSLEWIPFYILTLLRSMQAVRTGRPWLKGAWQAGFFLSLVALCDWYFVLYLFFFTGLVILWRWAELLRGRDAGGRASRLLIAGRAVMPAAIAALLFLLLLSPQLAPMVREAKAYDFMVRPAQDLWILSASVPDFFIPNRLHTLFRPARFDWIGNQIAPLSERTISLGYVALALAVVGLRRDRRRAGFWLLIALFFFVMALGPAIHWRAITWENLPADPASLQSRTPFGLLNASVPFMRISRSVSRYALMVQLAVALLAGLGAAALLASRRGRRGGLLFVALLVGVLAEDWVAPYPVSPPDTPAFYRQLAAQPGSGALLNLPMNYDRPGYLLYQTVHGRPLTVAYISRDDPRTLTERVPFLQHLRHLGPDILEGDPVRVAPTVLADLGVDYVVLDRYKMPGGLERTYTDALAQAVFAGQTPLFIDERITVFRVARPAVVEPYVQLGAANWGPLVEDEEGRRARMLLPGGAQLEMRHAEAGATLRLRYRTTTDAHLSILRDGRRIPLPDQLQGGAVTWPLIDITDAQRRVTLLAEERDSVWVEAVELLP